MSIIEQNSEKILDVKLDVIFCDLPHLLAMACKNIFFGGAGSAANFSVAQKYLDLFLISKKTVNIEDVRKASEALKSFISEFKKDNFFVESVGRKLDELLFNLDKADEIIGYLVREYSVRLMDDIYSEWENENAFYLWRKAFENGEYKVAMNNVVKIAVGEFLTVIESEKYKAREDRKSDFIKDMLEPFSDFLHEEMPHTVEALDNFAVEHSSKDKRFGRKAEDIKDMMWDELYNLVDGAVYGLRPYVLELHGYKIEE